MVTVALAYVTVTQQFTEVAARQQKNERQGGFTCGLSRVWRCSVRWPRFAIPIS